MTDGGPAGTEPAHAGEDDPRYRATLLSALMEASPNGILAVSPARKVLGFNRRFLELWQLPEGSVRVGGESPALMPECLDQVVDVQAFADGIRWGHTHPTEHQSLLVPLKDGRILQGDSGPVLAPDGTYLGRVWSLRDDSEQLAAEAERAELLTQLQAAQKAQTFLLEASAALTAASGYRETLERLAGLAVPALGDV